MFYRTRVPKGRGCKATIKIAPYHSPFVSGKIGNFSDKNHSSSINMNDTKMLLLNFNISIGNRIKGFTSNMIFFCFHKCVFLHLIFMSRLSKCGKLIFYHFFKVFKIWQIEYLYLNDYFLVPFLLKYNFSMSNWVTEILCFGWSKCPLQCLKKVVKGGKCWKNEMLDFLSIKLTYN